MSQQLPQRQVQNSGWRQDAGQSRYYSEESEFNSLSVTSVTSKASTAREGQNRAQEGTIDHHLNQKITFLKLNDDSSTNDLWIWLADAYALENEIDRSLLNGFWGVWFHQNHMVGDSILTALNKMKQMDHHQHSDGLLQEFSAMTQKHNESRGKYAVRLNMQPARFGSSLERPWVVLLMNERDYWLIISFEA